MSDISGAFKRIGPAMGQFLVVLFLILAVSGTTLAAVVIATNELRRFVPEIALTLVLLAGLIGLLAVLALVVAAFKLFDLNEEGEALGLPAGSVQAIIALGLILIFAIVGLYLHGQSGGREFVSTGLTAAQVKQIPARQTVEVDRIPPDDGDGGPTFDVRRRVSNEATEDITTQLLTTVSTLVVAVAGFYFGSKSVQEGRRRLAGNGSGQERRRRPVGKGGRRGAGGR